MVKMKVALLLFVLVFLVAQAITQFLEVVRTTKYQNIGACFFNNSGATDGRDNLTFVCVENTRQHNFLTPGVRSPCLNYNNGYEKPWIGTINFQDCERPEIPNDLYKAYTQLHTLNMTYLGLTLFAVDMFSYAERMVRLNAAHNEIVELPSFLFHKNEKLIEIDFSFNKIKLIDDYAFAGDFKLQKLNLSHNQLITLNVKVTDNLSKLKYLDIANNRISILEANSFGKIQKLVQLNLSANNISEIKPRTFSSLTYLEILDLSRNQLKTLKTDILPTQLNQMKLLSIGHNQLQELVGFNSARILNLKISGIDSNHFNCSYLDTLFKLITWKHLSEISNRINCNSNNESVARTTTVASTISNISSTPKIAPTNNTITILSSTEENKKIQTTKESNELYHKNSEGTHESSIKLMHTTLLINTAILLIIAIALVWMLLRRRKPKKNIFSQVTYHHNVVELPNAVENSEYEEILPLAQNNRNLNAPTNATKCLNNLF